MEDHVLAWLKDELNITDETRYLKDWIEARGDIMDVVVEALDMHHEYNILSRSERTIIDDYRCLSKQGKEQVNAYLNMIYDNECKAKKG